MGSSLFWFDNWTGLGALYFLVPPDFGVDESIHNVFEVLENSAWNVDRLLEILPEELALHIVENITPLVQENVLDTPYWMLETKGHFSVKSAWDYLRRRDDPRIAYKIIWVWRAKLSLGDFMRRLGYFMPSRCWCCADPKEKTLVHLFFTSKAATIVWKYFLGRAGIAVDGLTLHQKRRNSLKYREIVSVSRVIYQVSTTLQALVQVRKPSLRVPHRWQELLSMLENYTPRLKVDKVLWEFPMEGWIKVNIDGASRRNPGRSSIGFCVRDEVGDLRYTLGMEIAEGSNTEAEAVAIVEALKLCKTQNYSQIWLQTDSLLLKNIIEGSWKPPWGIIEHVEEIRNLMEEFNIRVSHIFREENKLADHLANYALDIGNIECYDFWQLVSQGGRIVNEDKIQCPYPHMVVLVLSTHSTRRKLKLGKSIEARRSTLLPRNAVICRGHYCGYDLFNDGSSIGLLKLTRLKSKQSKRPRHFDLQKGSAKIDESDSSFREVYIKIIGKKLKIILSIKEVKVF
uniref:RNase H type-1 domain-containing protein n=1 Tax=Nicotiana tabacum TaxID=4097 RepID=A0A1S4DIU6_TOBAC|nr:PREDICTED: uncharacterized protein LOC107830307 [Nicotiana tabacum]